MSQPNKKCELQRVLVFISILCILSKVCAQLCREQCYCPWVPPRCAPGVPLVLDGCGCCRICARQYGEACNQVYVCHHEQGLFCDYSAGYMGKGGLCNDEEDGNCEIDGKTYKNGEVFQPTCKMQCVCSDGGVTCTPLCSDNIQLPTSECPSPRRVQLPGKCCDQWICDQQQNRITNDAQSGKTVPVYTDGMKALRVPVHSEPGLVHCNHTLCLIQNTYDIEALIILGRASGLKYVTEFFWHWVDGCGLTNSQLPHVYTGK